MTLTLSLAEPPVDDLSFLLAKHPDRVQRFSFNHGQCTVFYPESSEQRQTVALLVQLDPIRLSRRPKHDIRRFSIQPYVNDRPYVASSFLSVALGRVFRSAISGICKDRPEVVGRELPLSITLPAVDVRGGPQILEQLFQPLGYTVALKPHSLDDSHPEWGQSRLVSATLQVTTTLQLALTHLYVLLPVLDNDKHYWIGDEEVSKLLDKGGDWLASHPEKSLIANRYLKHRRGLAKRALAQMATEEDQTLDDEAMDAAEAEVEKPLSLNQQRMDAVVRWIQEAGVSSVVDMGCGEGRLLRHLLPLPELTRIVGVDVSPRALEKASTRLKLDEKPEGIRNKIEVLQGSLLHWDERLKGIQALTLIEVIEHVDLPRLRFMVEALWRRLKPTLIIVTTPNRSLNETFENLPAGELRHHDHRFEWTEPEFQSWCQDVAKSSGYRVRFEPIGEVHATLGPPTQAAIFLRGEVSHDAA